MNPWIEDILTLLDGFREEFCPQHHSCNWDEMSREQKMEWYEEFARNHAHPVMLEGV